MSPSARGEGRGEGGICFRRLPVARPSKRSWILEFGAFLVLGAWCLEFFPRHLTLATRHYVALVFIQTRPPRHCHAQACPEVAQSPARRPFAPSGRSHRSGHRESAKGY